MQFKNTILVSILTTLALVDATCEYTGGNYYCSKTDKIVYSGIGYSGTYQDVTNMDESSGSCSQSSKSFSGNLSPLDEELSVHFRGPIKLLQFGVYTPSSSSSKKKRDEEEEDCATTLAHLHHRHKRATEYVQVTQTVLVDAQGNAITTSATVAAASTATAANAAVNVEDTTSSPSTVSTATNLLNNWWKGLSSSSASTTSTSSTAKSSSTSSSSSSTGDWERVSYYTPGSTDNCVFMNYYGGSGSGVWSSSFGNSLSYANSDASGGSSSAVALGEVTTKSDVEYIIFSGEKCGDNDGCGYYRSGIPAHHGFGGSKKIFVFEFEMPTASDSVSNNHDMPAVWLLNAKIPRTLQYGTATCSCWKTGCGELDLFEVLSSGSSKLISHLHDGQGNDGTSTGGGGTQDYFERPTSGSLKAAVIFDGEDVTIVEVDGDFASSLSSSTVQGWIGSSSGSVANISS